MLSKAFGLMVLAAFAAGICIVARAHAAPAEKTATLTLAGGCFWGVEAVFQHTKGVLSATPGYAGGTAETATYEQVSGGNTGHAEAVQVVYDPQQVTLKQLLEVYFTVAHDPTQLNRQGPDHGTQYRSAVFYNAPEQKTLVEAAIAALRSSVPIVTATEPLQAFYPAESYHCNYAARHPDQPYIRIHDAPKVVRLKNTFPELYVGPA